jgi:hypothetical protein
MKFLNTTSTTSDIHPKFVNGKCHKKGVMTQFPCARGRAFVCKNIGDYEQLVASAQFVDYLAVLVYMMSDESSMMIGSTFRIAAGEYIG